jgi:type VI secretion system protein ImpA
MAIDVEALLAEVDPESPCGEDLTYDPEYLELERVAQGTPEHQVGSTVVQAEEPDWRDVRDKAVALFGRTKDLRVGMHVALASLQLDGVLGLRDGLALLRGLVERYWEQVYPQLDPEDDYDPLERMNILSALSPPAEVYADPMQFRQRARAAALCRSKQLGSFSLRDLLVARGEMAPADAGASPPELPVIEAAFQDTEVDYLQEVATAAQEGAEHLDILDSLITQRVGVGKAPNLGELRGIAEQIAAFVNEFLSRRGAAVGPGVAEAAPGGAEAGAGAAAGPAISGEIRSPQDVIRVLDKVCEYYQRQEPSSPVPLLVKRAKRLVRKNFVEIIQDLTPDSLRQIEMIGGPTEEPPG